MRAAHRINPDTDQGSLSDTVILPSMPSSRRQRRPGWEPLLGGGEHRTQICPHPQGMHSWALCWAQAQPASRAGLPAAELRAGSGVGCLPLSLSHTHPRTYTHTHPVHIHTHPVHIHTHTYVHMLTHTDTHAYTHTHNHTHLYAYIHTHLYTYTYTPIYTHTHTHTPIYTLPHTLSV